MIKICQFCGNEFSSKKSGKLYCCREHYFADRHKLNDFKYEKDCVIIYIDTKYGQKKCFVDIDDYENKIKTNRLRLYAYKTNYVYFCFHNDKKKHKLHRYLMNVIDKKDIIIDHINRNPLDNRKRNLRLVNYVLNSQNTICMKRSKSKVKGVDWHVKRQRWRGLVQVNHKRHFVGWFKDFEECCKAVDEKRKELLEVYCKENNISFT